MSIKKSLLALAAAAMAVMAFASPALATDGVIRDTNGDIIADGTVLHTIGWARFKTGGGSYMCHVTSVVKAKGANGTTGQVTSFTVPKTEECTGTGVLNGCKLSKHESTNLPYHVTVTDNGRVDVTGEKDKEGEIEKQTEIVLDNEYTNCLAKKVTLTFTSVQLTPLATGTRTVTGVPAETGKLGETAVLNQEIAGFEIDGTTGPNTKGGMGEGKGLATITNIFGGVSEEAITAVEGEFELTAEEGGKKQRCTYKISAT